MLKTILKVAYFAFAVVIAVVVYMMAYQTSSYDHVSATISGYIEEKDYDSVGRIFGAIFNADEIVNLEYDKVDVVLYQGTTETNVSYNSNPDDEESKAEVYHAYDSAYYLYLFNNEFNTQNVSSDVVTNSTAVRFIGANNNEYDYLFKISDNINSKQYIEKPTTLKEAMLNEERDLFANNTNWGFHNIVIDEVTVDYIEEELGSEIVAFNIVDGAGELVCDQNIEASFDFVGQFYTDTKVIRDAYDKFMPVYDKYTNDEIKKADYEEALKVFNDETEEFSNYLMSEENTKYLLAFSQKELMPSSLIWKAVGIVLLFAVCVVIIYILLFKFAWIKKIVFRDRNTNFRPTPNKMPIKPNVKQEAINAKVKEVKPEPKKDTTNIKADKPKSEPINQEPVEAVEEVKVQEAVEVNEEVLEATAVEEITSIAEEPVTVVDEEVINTEDIKQD